MDLSFVVIVSFLLGFSLAYSPSTNGTTVTLGLCASISVIPRHGSRCIRASLRTVFLIRATSACRDRSANRREQRDEWRWLFTCRRCGSSLANVRGVTIAHEREDERAKETSRAGSTEQGRSATNKAHSWNDSRRTPTRVAPGSRLDDSDEQRQQQQQQQQDAAVTPLHCAPPRLPPRHRQRCLLSTLFHRSSPHRRHEERASLGWSGWSG